MGAETPPPPEDRPYEVALIAAVAANGVIGRDGEMPWHHPEDLQQFKRTTVGHPVVIGRRTYERIVERLGEPLPDRTNVVLSSQALDLPEGAVLANSVPEALAVAAAALDADRNTVYVAGGATVYEATIPVADRLELTELDAAHEGDTYFPTVDPAVWRETARDDRSALSFVSYERRDDPNQ
jgi:dihydrofolate reductase